MDDMSETGTVRLELGKESVEIIGTVEQAQKIHSLIEDSISRAFWTGCVCGSAVTAIMAWAWS